VRSGLLRLGRLGLSLYSSDAVFVLAGNLAVLAVFVLLLTWILLTIEPYLPATEAASGEPAIQCSDLAGQCRSSPSPR
jgi:hypothetical protein